MNENILLSICIPTYNREKCIKKQLEYLKSELALIEGVELLVANNASTDNTDLVVRSFLEEMNFKYYCNKENLGILGNMKLLLENACGKYIWFVGDDDILEKDLLKYVIAKLKDNNISGICFNNNKTHKEFVNPNPVEQFIEALPIVKGRFLFITGNIIMRDSVQEIFNKIPITVEESWSMPLIFQIVAAKLNPNSKLIIENRNCIINDLENISWANFRYELLARYNARIFYYLDRFGFSKKEIKRIVGTYFKAENKRIFLEIMKHSKKAPKEALKDYCWYLKEFPLLCTFLTLTLPFRSIFYLISKKMKAVNEES